MLKVDLHLHTSDDPVDRIHHDNETLIDRAAALGYHALAITLHERQLRYERLDAFARERGIVLLPGIERTIDGRHVLLINFPQAAERAASFDDVASLKRRSEGLVIAPHPFFPAPSCLGETMDRYRDLFDAVEWSYFWTPLVNFNARARRWAEARGLAVVGNSDLHDLRQLGRTYSLVESEPDAGAICEAIRNRRVTVCSEPVPAMELVSVLGGMFMRGRRRASTGQGLATDVLAAE